MAPSVVLCVVCVMMLQEYLGLGMETERTQLQDVDNIQEDRHWVEDTLRVVMDKLEKAEEKWEKTEEKLTTTEQKLKKAEEDIKLLQHEERGEIICRPAREVLPTAAPKDEDNSCLGWSPYLDEKCVFLVEKAGLQNKDDAEQICRSYGEEDDVPRLVTIKTKKQQEVLNRFIFIKHGVFDNVQLGLESGEDGAFKWNDGTELLFSNWANESAIPEGRYCVQMETGQGHYPAGQWTVVSCKKKNAVVCERTRRWTLHKLKERLFNIKQEHEVQLEKLQEGVPIGFIYVQLAGQDPPTKLWPQVSWKDVSHNYSGLFFRVTGDDAAPFGQIQEASTNRFEAVETVSKSYSYPRDTPLEHQIPSNGTWSGYVYTGQTWDHPYNTLRFKTSASEIRPRNQAVVIWKRVA